MGNLLLDESPLVIQQGLAKKLGLNKAIVVQQVHYLLKQRKEKDRNKYFHQGNWWVYNTYTDWKENFFDFWSIRTVRRTFNELEEDGIFISSDQFNQKKYDQTKWYTINYQSLDRYMAEEEEKPPGQDGQSGGGQNDQPGEDKMTTGGGQSGQTNTKEVPKSNNHLSIDKGASVEKINSGEPTAIRDAFERYWRITTPNPSQLLKLTEAATELSTEVVIEGMKRARYKNDPFQYCFGLNPEEGKGLINKWMQAGVSSLEDIKKLDRKHQEEKQLRRDEDGRSQEGSPAKSRGSQEEVEEKYTDY
ncbi:hypothetical protein Halha_2173 [Halobacteroides halobius DSM 5150]|uniref:DnaD-like protein n=1 Tax=Halobacteroides halobius (strain ATCC 35273 / DSM 5150 / MD-1) TaxID=748449 RepID=L0KBX4_HALHC|nr:hypothetical protein [Halobacteroides halobius]AGB42055.1 hypothetical protein Halha_2173 [Halobacteroides halobius DSM 5150]